LYSFEGLLTLAEPSNYVIKNFFENYFFVTFSSFITAFAIKNTTIAIMMKFTSSPMNAPTPQINGPKEKVAVFHAPPGIIGVIVGITILSTSDFMSEVAATPITNAIASPATLYSLMKSLNSLSKSVAFPVTIKSP